MLTQRIKKIENEKVKTMLNDKMIIQVCLRAQATEEKISQDLEEVRKDLRSIYPLNRKTCNEIDELKILVEKLEIKLKEFTLIYAYEGYRILSGDPEKPIEQEEEAPF